jgi:hypothetical protein
MNFIIFSLGKSQRIILQMIEELMSDRKQERTFKF